MWQIFWFKAEKWRGPVDSKEKWEEVVAVYKKKGGVNFLRNAQEHPFPIRNMPEFGISKEHTGFFTLGKWADQNGIDLSVE